MSEPSSTSIHIFTTSLSPLPLRFPFPRKPTLLLPALIHRSLHQFLDPAQPSFHLQSSSSSSSTSAHTLTLPHPEDLIKHDIPKLPPSSSEDEDTDSELDITVKLHLVSSASTSTRISWISDAISLLNSGKGISKIDTLLIGFKGIDYKGSKTPASEFFGCGSEGLENPNGNENVSQELILEVVDIWKGLVERFDNGSGVGQLGSLYLPLGLLRVLNDLEVEGKRIGPKVNSMDTPDCHSLPKEYLGFAREQGIELWAGGGGEGSDPLPSAYLHNLLQEFQPKLSSLLSPTSNLSSQGVPPPTPSPLSDLIPLREDGLKYDEQIEPSVNVKWVLGYTLVSKSRNVVKDKGYIVAADLTL